MRPARRDAASAPVVEHEVRRVLVILLLASLHAHHREIDLVSEADERAVGRLVAQVDRQDHARQTEIRAQTLCRNAIEKLRLAETRTEAAERALNLAESRIASAEARLCAAELRAKSAETRARELDQALTLIEKAIRTRLLGAGRNVRTSSAGIA